jgi:hypothetical protein
MKFKIWSDHFVHVSGARYKGQSFVVEAPTIDDAIKEVSPSIPPGRKVISYTVIEDTSDPS